MEAFSTWFEISDYVKNNIGMQTRDSIFNLVNHQQLDALITEYNLNESTIVKNWRSKSMKAGEASLVLLALRKLDINAKRQKEKEMNQMYNHYKKELSEEKEHIEHLNEHIEHLNDKNKDILENANYRRTFIDFIANEIGNEKMNSIHNKFMGKREQNNQITDDENKQNDQDTDDEDDLMKSSESEPIIVIAHSYIIKNKNKVRRATFNPKTDYAFNTQDGFYISGENQELVSKFSIDISEKCIGYIILKDGTKITTLTKQTVIDNRNNIKMIILVRKSKNDKENKAVLNELYNTEKGLLQFKSRTKNNKDTYDLEEEMLNMNINNMAFEDQIKLAMRNSMTPPSSPDRSVLAQAAENRTTVVSDRRKFSKQIKLFIDKVTNAINSALNPGDGLAKQLFFIAKLGNVEKEIQWTGKPIRIKDIADDLIWNVLFNYIKKYGETFIPESIWGDIKSIWSQNTQQY